MAVQQLKDTASPLRQALEDAIAEHGGGLSSYTVLANQNDPFRVDTPARHRDGEWLAITAQELGLGRRRIHLRGLHYMVIGRPKPDGKPYTNTDADWNWLSSDCAKAARWLGYLPFDQIKDERNSAPIIRTWQPPDPYSYIATDVEVEIPDVDNLKPRAGVEDFSGIQPYKLVVFGEKSSLEDVLKPIAQNFKADLYLPTGEISDTLLYLMAKTGAIDGRPMVVFCFSDADPAGWQMPISISRKLQAFRALGRMQVPVEDSKGNQSSQLVNFAGLDFQVHRVALTPELVSRYGLPSTPLKETERRADEWKAAFNVEQTEIDALASLRPDLLRQLARDAMSDFYDTGLDRRVKEAQADWIDRAQAVVDAGLDHEKLERIRGEVAKKLSTLRTEINELNNALRVDADDFDLPEIDIPEAEIDEDSPIPLMDSRWSFLEQCQALIDSKRYRL